MLSRELLSRGRRPSYIVEVHPGRLGNKIMGAPVISPEKLRQIPPKPIIVSVAKREPRGLVRNALSEMEFIELTDYVCAA